MFVKSLAAGQISWLCIQLGARRGRNIPTTQLEVVTLSFAVCSLITYLLLYNRPKGIQTTLEIVAARYPRPDESARITNIGPATFGPYRSELSIPNNSIHYSHGPCYFHPAIIASLVIFGGLHFVAWDYAYPTQIEKTLWLASSIIHDSSDAHRFPVEGFATNGHIVQSEA